MDVPPHDRTADRRARRSAPSLLCAVLVAAAAAPITATRFAAEVRAAGFEPEQLIEPWQLGEPEREWLALQAPGHPPEERIQLVFHQLLDDSGLAIQYDAQATGTASEVFHRRRANCLGFTMLFVGLARALGLEARFLRVDERVNYRREGDLIFVSEHVTAGYEASDGARVVEFTLGPAYDYRSARPISDLTALALFYSNRGAEALRQGQADEAVRWLEVAVRLDPAEAPSWTNLGVARRRLGRLGVAEEAHRRAIAADPEHVPAYMNLATVLRMRGETESWREILRLMDRRGNTNPFAYLAMGDASLEQGLLGDARRYYRRALRLARRSAETRAAMGQWAMAAGDPDRARRWLRRAQRIDSGEGRTRKLAERLAEPEPDPEPGGGTPRAGVI